MVLVSILNDWFCLLRSYQGTRIKFSSALLGKLFLREQQDNLGSKMLSKANRLNLSVFLLSVSSAGAPSHNTYCLIDE